MTDLHPFERSGLGIGPFRFSHAVSLPNPSLAEHNPEAFNNALRMLPRDVPLGSCQHCGMAIMHNMICVSSDGKKFAVGSDCVFKIGDKSLGNAIKVAVAKREREARLAKSAAARAARHAQWLIDNADRLKIEAEIHAANIATAAAKRAAVTAQWAFMLPILDQQNSPFCVSVAQTIRDGHAPRGRAVFILGDIFAKQAGRAGSKAFEAARTEFDKLITTEE